MYAKIFVSRILQFFAVQFFIFLFLFLEDFFLPTTSTHDPLHLATLANFSLKYCAFTFRISDVISFLTSSILHKFLDL